MTRLWLAALLLPAPAAAQGERPAPTTARYDEDWAMLAAAPRTGTDALKYVPIDTSTYLTTGLELRARDESYQGTLWGDAPDDSYLWTRALAYADLHAGPTRGFVQVLAAYAAGVRPAAGPVDQTRVDILQAFADIDLALGPDTTLTLRGGRELLPLGTERLVGTRYGPNVPLAFDGARAIVRTGTLTANVFYVRPVHPGPASFDDRPTGRNALWGVYATRDGIDLYYLGYRNDRATFDQGSGRELRHSVGARVFGGASGWHWNVEAIAQFGRFAGLPIRAWSVGSEAGHAFTRAPFKPDVTIRFNVVSGDGNRRDRRLGTFNALFPKGKYFGELSPLGPYNIVNLNPGVSLDLGDGFGLALAANLYWRQSRGDGIYDIPGNLIRSGDGATARFVGREAEAILSWQATPALSLSGSLSAFAPGAFVRETGSARTITLQALEASYVF